MSRQPKWDRPAKPGNRFLRVPRRYAPAAACKRHPAEPVNNGSPLPRPVPLSCRAAATPRRRQRRPFGSQAAGPWGPALGFASRPCGRFAFVEDERHAGLNPGHPRRFRTSVLERVSGNCRAWPGSDRPGRGSRPCNRLAVARSRVRFYQKPRSQPARVKSHLETFSADFGRWPAAPIAFESAAPTRRDAPAPLDTPNKQGIELLNRASPARFGPLGRGARRVGWRAGRLAPPRRRATCTRTGCASRCFCRPVLAM